MQRRKFLKNSTIGTAGLISTPLMASCQDQKEAKSAATGASEPIRPLAICTWDFSQRLGRSVGRIEGRWEFPGCSGTGGKGRRSRCGQPNRWNRGKTGPRRQGNLGCLHYGQGWQLRGGTLHAEHCPSHIGGSKGHGRNAPCNAGRKGGRTICL